MITLSITTCRRFDLFQRTIKSFHENCLDGSDINLIYHFDDSSTEEDRLNMETIIKTLFPNSLIRNYRFNSESFPGKKRHCYIMCEWLNVIKSESSFNFHLEDDWLFDSKFSLFDLKKFLENKKQAAYAGVSQFLRDFPDDVQFEVEDNYWKWYYDPNKGLLENLFLDTKIIEKSGIEGFWCYYINWPYFGFRPGLWDVKKLENINSMNCDSDLPFELKFALELSKEYVSYCTIDSVCHHIGDGGSSYDLNNSER